MISVQGTRYWRNRVARVAKKFPEVTFAIAAKSDYNNKMTDWGWKADDDGVHAVAFDAKKNTYKMTEMFSVDNLQQFVTEFASGSLKPYIKSEPIPEDNTGPVKVGVVSFVLYAYVFACYSVLCGEIEDFEVTINTILWLKSGPFVAKKKLAGVLSFFWIFWTILQ